jgi:hypothetical protein
LRQKEAIDKANEIAEKATRDKEMIEAQRKQSVDALKQS